MRYRFRFVFAAVVAFYCATVAWSAHAVFGRGDVSVYSDFGPIEKLQAGVLALCCIVFLAPVFSKRQPAKLISAYCSMLCLAFFLRELDVERLGVHRILVLIGSGAGRDIIIASGFIALSLYAVFYVRYYAEAGVRFLRSVPGILLMAAVPLLITGRFFDKSDALVHMAYYEEMLELLAYCFILLSALATNLVIRRRPSNSLPR